MTRIYTLTFNGQTLLEVDMESPAWLPVKPRVNRRWLRSLVVMAFTRCFSPQTEEEAQRVCLN